VGSFDPIVGVACGVVDNRRHNDPLSGAVAPEAIGDKAARDTAAPPEQFAKEPSGGVAISARLEQDVDDIAVLVDGPPAVLTLTANSYQEFVQMPRVVDCPGSLPQPPRVREAEGLAPLPDGFVRDRDAAMREEVFDVAQAQGEAAVEPNGVADDGGRESVARIADDVIGYPATPHGPLKMKMPGAATTKARFAAPGAYTLIDTAAADNFRNEPS
jgi:hypothetical protein